MSFFMLLGRALDYRETWKVVNQGWVQNGDVNLDTRVPPSCALSEESVKILSAWFTTHSPLVQRQHFSLCPDKLSSINRSKQKIQKSHPYKKRNRWLLDERLCCILVKMVALALKVWGAYLKKQCCFAYYVDYLRWLRYLPKFQQNEAPDLLKLNRPL